MFFYFLPTQEFSDSRDADDARYSLNGRDFDGSRIIVEFAKGVSHLSFHLLFCFTCNMIRVILSS